MEVLARIPGVRKLVFFYPIWDQLAEQLPPWEEQLLVRVSKKYDNKLWLIAGRACRLRYGYALRTSTPPRGAQITKKNTMDPSMINRSKSRKVKFVACLSGPGGDLLIEFPAPEYEINGGEVLPSRDAAERVIAAQILGGAE